MARKKLDTLTEPMYYTLLSLLQPRHGYGIMQYISELTAGRVNVGAGTLYALLARFEAEHLIVHTHTSENRKYYRLTEEGLHILTEEYHRLSRQAADAAGLLEKEVLP